MASVTKTGIYSTISFLLLAYSAFAEWPEKPIRFIVPYSAGSTGEIVGRLLGEAIRKKTGQPVVIETKPGGGGNIGVASVVNTPADDYTFVFGAANNFVINQFLFKLPFDPASDLAPITKVVDVPSVIVSAPSITAKTLPEFVAYAKANSGKINYASPGNGTAPHLSVELLKQQADIDLVHVA